MEMLLALAGLGLGAFLAATLLPGGSELALAGLVAAGTAPVWLLVLVASIGNIAGSVVNWGLGRGVGHLAGDMSVTGRRAQAVQAAFARAGDLFRRYGSWTLLLSWVPVIGDPLTLVAGASGISLSRFLVLVAIGKTARFVLVAAAAYYALAT